MRSQWARLRLLLSAFFPNLFRKTHTRPQPTSRSLSAASATPETHTFHLMRLHFFYFSLVILTLTSSSSLSVISFINMAGVKGLKQRSNVKSVGFWIQDLNLAISTRMTSPQKDITKMWKFDCFIKENKKTLSPRAAVKQHLSSVLSPPCPPPRHPQGSPSDLSSRTGSVSAASCLRPCVSCGSGSWWRREGNASDCRCPAPADHLTNEISENVTL